VGETLAHIAQVGRRKPVYAIYVLDPDDHHLIHVVSLRDLVVTDSTTRIMDIGEHRGLLKVTPMTDREDVARLLSKYNLLAVPVVDEHGHLLGTITVDDVIDAVVKEQTEAPGGSARSSSARCSPQPPCSISSRSSVRRSCSVSDHTDGQDEPDAEHGYHAGGKTAKSQQDATPDEVRTDGNAHIDECTQDAVHGLARVSVPTSLTGTQIRRHLQA